MTHGPFVIGEFIAVVVRWHDIHQKNVFGFWVQPGDLHFEAWKHPSVDKYGKILQHGLRTKCVETVNKIVTA